MSRTLSGLFLVGALNRPRKRKATNRENPRIVPEQIGKIPETSGKSQKGQKRTKKKEKKKKKRGKKEQKKRKKRKEGQKGTKKEGQVQIGKNPPFETPPFGGPCMMLDSKTFWGNFVLQRCHLNTFLNAQRIFRGFFF